MTLDINFTHINKYCYEYIFKGMENCTQLSTLTPQISCGESESGVYKSFVQGIAKLTTLKTLNLNFKC